jgi:uncharacterized membrane protein YgaE (UPF0421/DUF939 family)
MPFHDFPHSLYWKHSFKTALAAGLTLSFSGLLNLPEPHWACLSAVLVMQSDHGATAEESRNRLIGTAIGALLGLLAVILADRVGVYSWLFYTATIWVCMLLAGALDLHGCGRFAGVAATVVMLIPSSQPHRIIALHRFFEVSFGIFMAYAISRLLWPGTAPKSSKHEQQNT